MNHLTDFISQNQAYAPWISLLLILLAGLNVPISIDVILVLAAFLAATTIPEYTFPLYFSILIGSILSAQLAYFLGRTLGRKLLKYKWFSFALNEKRVEKLNKFYTKHGFSTFIIGRFIPFGVRNCLFMSSGISKVHFGKFALYDSIACLIWATITFFLFFRLGSNYEMLLHYLKTFNLVIFFVFGLTVISIVWYKRRKRKTT